MAIAHRVWPSLAYAAGLVLVYFGERVVQAGRASMVLNLLGILGVVGAILWRALATRKAPEGLRRTSRMLVLLYGLGALALAMHFLGGGPLLGRPLESHMPRLAGALSVLWPALILAGTLPVLLVELSLAGMASAPVIDSARVRAALLSGVGTALALVFCFSLAYVTAEANVKVDLAYFRTARPGTATQKLVSTLDQPVEVFLFYPPANEVGEELASYFADLTRLSSHLKVTRLDQAVELTRAKELGVSGNGMVVVTRDKLRESIPIPVKLESARGRLRTLDREVYKRLITVTREARTAYFVQGHEERTFSNVGETDRRTTVRMLRDLLGDLGLRSKELSMAQGLGNDVPADAGLVLMIGPRRPLMASESEALLRYFERKGRLLVALEPEGGEAATELLKGLSLHYDPTVLANDKIFWARTRQKADRIGIATGSYAHHPSIELLNSYGMRLPLVLLGSGSLSRPDKPAANAPSVSFIVHAEAGTYDDRDGNFEFDAPKETRKAYELAAAISKSASSPEDESRALVLADSDMLADELLVNRANGMLAYSMVRWLTGDERLAGTMGSEEDVPVRHTRKQDVVWFYASVFAAPTLLLGLGFVATRRRRTSRRAPGTPSSPSSESTP